MYSFMEVKGGCCSNEVALFLLASISDTKQLICGIIVLSCISDG